MFRDRLVCGINDEAIQHQLLGKLSLDLEKVLELAQGMGAAAQNVDQSSSWNREASRNAFGK